MLPFINYKWFYFMSKSKSKTFSSTGMHQSHHLVVCHATVIKTFLISFLYALHALFISVTQSQKFNINNSFRIIIIKTIIIKDNIIKVDHIVTKNVTLSESSSTKTMSSLESITSSSFSSNLIKTSKRGRTLMVTDKHISRLLNLSRHYFIMQLFNILLGPYIN